MSVLYGFSAYHAVNSPHLGYSKPVC